MRVEGVLNNSETIKHGNPFDLPEGRADCDGDQADPSIVGQTCLAGKVKGEDLKIGGASNYTKAKK